MIFPNKIESFHVYSQIFSTMIVPDPDINPRLYHLGRDINFTFFPDSSFSGTPVITCSTTGLSGSPPCLCLFTQCPVNGGVKTGHVAA